MKTHLWLAVLLVFAAWATASLWACGDDDDETGRVGTSDDDADDDDDSVPDDDDDDDDHWSDDDDDDDDDDVDDDDDDIFEDRCPEVTGTSIGLCDMTYNATLPWDEGQQAWSMDTQLTFEGFLTEGSKLVALCEDLEIVLPQTGLGAYADTNGGEIDETMHFYYDMNLVDPAGTTVDCKVYVTDSSLVAVSNKLDATVSFDPRV